MDRTKKEIQSQHTVSDEKEIKLSSMNVADVGNLAKRSSYVVAESAGDIDEEKAGDKSQKGGDLKSDAGT